MDSTNIIQTATDLQVNHTKLELVSMARAYGWKGDHARAPILQLALFVATKLAAGERNEQHSGNHRGEQPERPSQQDGQQDGQQSEQDGQQGQQGQQSEQDGQQDGQDGQQDGQDGQQSEQEQDGQQGQQEQEQEQDGQQSEQEQDGQQSEQEQEPPEQADADSEYAELLAASGIKAPHVLLEKVWRLTAKAKQNVLLVGPAGCGKTMLSAQLAQLLRIPFGSISCTMGMSESQLSGWLLPIGEHGRFDYVPAPFIKCLQEPSVFLLDELDAADPNVLMLANSVWSNGFITIPHKLDNPTIQRHTDAIIIAGANTVGTGADELYSARSALDGATVDRFYPVVVDYDEAYEAGLFAVGRKSRRKSAPWQASTEKVDAIMLDQAKAWFFKIRKGSRKARINKLVSTRLAQRLVSAMLAGIPMAEAMGDLLMGWSDDEKARSGHNAN